jgi:hypothetical protein
MTFSAFLDIFYPPNFDCFEKNGLFQQPQAISLIENAGVSVAVPVQALTTESVPG